MAERRVSLRTGREAGDLVGDAVMASLADLVARLHVDAPAASAVADAEPVAVAEHAPSSRRLPTRAAVDLVGGLVAAIVPVVVSRIDPNEILDQVDVQRVIDRVDVDEVVKQIDLDDLASRLDVDALLARVDIDALVKRIDMSAVAREAIQGIDLGELIRDSTATIGSDIVDDLRVQAMRADELLARLVDVVLRRKKPRRRELDPAGTR